MYLSRSTLHSHASKLSGFSLVELMITIAVASILLGIAVPSFSSFMQKTKMNALTGSLVTTLREARNEAIKRNGRVLVCASNTGGTDCAASTVINWGAAGWLVCFDLDADSACDTSTAAMPNPIRRERAIDAKFATVIGPGDPIRFTSTGTQGDVGAATATITATGKWTGATALNITVAATGLIKGKRL